MEREYWPTEGWRTSSPEEQGLSGETLAHIHELGLETDPPANGFLIVRHGYIVYEEYFRGFHEGSYHSVNSVTKSLVSALIGIAMRDGLIESLDQPMVELFPKIGVDDERKRRVTIRHVLTMTGEFVEHEHVPQDLVRSDDAAQLIWSRPLSHEPGEHFLYDNETPHLLSLALSRLTGMSAADYAFKELFAPLGIWTDAAARSFWRDEPFGRHTSLLAGRWPESGLPWKADHHGHSLGYAGTHFTPREMAKLGWLYLHRGRWDGRQIVQEAYVVESTRPHSRGMTPVGMSAPTPYGYLWWLRDDSPAFVASGFGGQQIWVQPETDLVVATASSQQYGAPALIGRVVVPAILDEGARDRGGFVQPTNDAYLEEPWRSCFELAWAAFQASSVPVGAVVVDSGGRIVTRGRYRRFDLEPAPGQLVNTNLAHAEMNALAPLPPGTTPITSCSRRSIPAFTARWQSLMRTSGESVSRRPTRCRSASRRYRRSSTM